MKGSLGRRWIRLGMVGMSACAALARSRAARGSDDMIAVAWTRSEDDQALLRRVQGQVSDLAVSLQTDASPRTGTLAEQLAEADGVARAHDAKVVLWFEPLPEGRGVLVVVADTQGNRVLVRRIESKRPAETLASLDSATLESASLVVRTSLRALTEGGVIGIGREDLAAPVPPRPVEPVRQPLPAPAPAPLPPAEPESRLHWVAAVGWQVTVDGSTVQQGLAAQVGLRVGGVSFGVSAAQSFGAEITGTYATVAVARDAFAAFGELAWVRTKSLSASARLSTGAVIFPRSTSATELGVTATPSEVNPTYFAGLEVPLRYSPGALHRRVTFWLSVGADVMPAPTFGYRIAGTFVPMAALWPIQPHGAAGIEVGGL